MAHDFLDGCRTVQTPLEFAFAELARKHQDALISAAKFEHAQTEEEIIATGEVMLDAHFAFEAAEKKLRWEERAASV